MPGVLPTVVIVAAGCLVGAAAIYSERVASLAVRAHDPAAGPQGQDCSAPDSWMPSVAMRGTISELTIVLLSSILVQVLRVVQAYCLGLALGVSAPVWAYFVFIPLIVIIMQVPITLERPWHQSTRLRPVLPAGWRAVTSSGRAVDPLRRPCARRQPAGGAALHDRFGKAIRGPPAVIGGLLYVLLFAALVRHSVSRSGSRCSDADTPRDGSPAPCSDTDWWRSFTGGSFSSGSPVVRSTLLSYGTWSLLVLRPFRHNTAPWIVLPVWTRRDTLALLLVLLLVPLLQWRPFSRLGEVDASGARRYRAYFTADFLWHVALPPSWRKSHRRLEILTWLDGHCTTTGPTSFPRAHVVRWLPLRRTRVPSAGQRVLRRAVVRFGDLRFGLVRGAARRSRGGRGACVVLAASAEGAYALWDFWSRGRPLSGVRELNIDAITAWWFQTLTIDSLPRRCGTRRNMRWPAHSRWSRSSSRAWRHERPLRPRSRRPRARTRAIFSPFLGGAFSTDLRGRQRPGRRCTRSSVMPLSRYALAAIPVLTALGWCVAAGTFEGSGAPSRLGLSRSASAAPLALSLLRWVPCSCRVHRRVLRAGATWPLPPHSSRPRRGSSCCTS